MTEKTHEITDLPKTPWYKRVNKQKLAAGAAAVGGVALVAAAYVAGVKRSKDDVVDTDPDYTPSNEEE